MNFILLHGSFNSYKQLKEFWLPKLENLCQPLGHKVILPHLPTYSFEEVTNLGIEGVLHKQSLEIWLKAIEPHTDLFIDNKTIFICHSTGPLFALHLLSKYPLILDSAIFVCPFLNRLIKSTWQVNKVNETYYKSDFDFEKLKTQIPLSYVFYGTDDPYVDTEQSLLFASKLNSEVAPVVGGGHLNKKENADLILELCKTRIKHT
ncbi:MAG: alpha/beta hydrolase [Patescibacteria group bacterium]